MKYSLCPEPMYFEIEYFGASTENLIKGMELAKEAGIQAIEFWSWDKKDINAIIKAKSELNMEVAAICTKFINICDSPLRESYTEALKETLEVAKRLECKTIISQAGYMVEGLSKEDHHKSIVDGLKSSAPILENTGVTLVVEPLNTLVNHPGYYLWSSKEAFEIIGEVGSPNVKVLFDIYHQQIMEGNIIANITKNIDKIGHIHAAGNPGRNEITSGEINYEEVFKEIANTGFNSYCGLEYRNTKDILTGLKEAAKIFSY